MQALILVGGEGTRLRPLTTTIPKPIVPLVGQPLIGYMLSWLRSHGVDEVVLSCGFLADGVRGVLGDGARFGVNLSYVEEPRPLGTAGALKYAERLLDERFVMLNGDILTDIDLTAQLAAHERRGARATLGLIAVEDPSAYGLVRLRDDGSVGAFLEKPAPAEIDTNLINGGVYVLERELLDELPPSGATVSIERDVFPALVDRGLYGYRASGYWLDIGTPRRYLEASTDILDGTLSSELPHVRVGAGTQVAASAILDEHTVLGADVRIGDEARVTGSVLLDGVSVGARAVVQEAIIAPRCRLGEGCRIDQDAVLGEGVEVPPAGVVLAGARIFPEVQPTTGAAAP